ncbi:MAG TPA: NFACT RNA binding domain-containing protein [Holophagaceae bacterium]|jgi:hypothetical protein|nr:NFACT RNA binding domain-containing protein [Holophagaceae bacterium]
MDAPLLLALARAQGRAHPAWALEGAWASDRALGLRWGRKADADTWILLLHPRPALWRLPVGHAAAKILAAEAKKDSAQAWGAWLSGARLLEVQGHPGERWLGLVFQRRAISGRLETVRVAFQAIPGRAGIRLDGVDVAAPRLGLGVPFPATMPVPGDDPPPLKRWREHYGEHFEAAVSGEMDEVLPGEGSLLARHRDWSMAEAEALVLAPRRAAAERILNQKAAKLARLEAALEKDRARHEKGLALKPQAAALSGELWRLKGAEGEAVLEDGTIIALPRGETAESAVQTWFAEVKKAGRGLARLEELESGLVRQRAELAERRAALERGEGLEAAPPKAASSREKAKREPRKVDKRKDGKGTAFRSVQIEGFELLIGKGDAENDQLTFKVAENTDFWLHVANMPGSHVVIRNPDKVSEPPRLVLERAAELAAFHSKARDAGKVEVHWCRIADISKPRGFAPGKVILKQWKSLRVYPKG